MTRLPFSDGQRRAAVCRVLVQQPGDLLRAQRTSLAGREQRVIVLALALAEPDAQDFDGAGCERRDALLSSFGAHRRMRLIIRMSYVFG